MTLADFILARIADDEAEWAPEVNDLVMGGIAARVLAECEAKRRIVEMLQHPAENGEPVVREYARLTLELMARVFADHPDYDESWRP